MWLQKLQNLEMMALVGSVMDAVIVKVWAWTMICWILRIQSHL